MNALQMAQNAYATSQAPIRTPRTAEYEAFARATHRLQRASEHSSPNLSDMAHALQENRRLWTILAADVAEDGNQLPPELRGRIFYLAEFTRQYSSKVLKSEAPADVLIDINTAVMRGLRQAEAAR